MQKTITNIICIIIVAFVLDLFPKDISSYLDLSRLNNLFVTQEVIEIDQPTQSSIDSTKEISKEILNKADRKTITNIAVFNDEFARKIDSYKDSQVESKYIIGLYVSSYKKAFGESQNLSSTDSVSSYIKENIVSKEKFMTNEEIDLLKDFFRGISWNLITKNSESK